MAYSLRSACLFFSLYYLILFGGVSKAAQSFAEEGYLQAQPAKNRMPYLSTDGLGGVAKENLVAYNRLAKQMNALLDDSLGPVVYDESGSTLEVALQTNFHIFPKPSGSMRREAFDLVAGLKITLTTSGCCGSQSKDHFLSLWHAKSIGAYQLTFGYVDHEDNRIMASRIWVGDEIPRTTETVWDWLYSIYLDTDEGDFASCVALIDQAFSRLSKAL